jgi:hypothetical protein
MLTAGTSASSSTRGDSTSSMLRRRGLLHASARSGSRCAGSCRPPRRIREPRSRSSGSRLGRLRTAYRKRLGRASCGAGGTRGDETGMTAEPPQSADRLPAPAGGRSSSPPSTGSASRFPGAPGGGRARPAGSSASAAERRVVDRFHRLFYEARDHVDRTHWLARASSSATFPTSGRYRRSLVDTRLDLIVVDGKSYLGGSARYLASLCDSSHTAWIVRFDPWSPPRPGRPEHERITYLEGSSTKRRVVGADRRARRSRRARHG